VNPSQPDQRGYMKLAALIRDQIASGEIAPGDLLSIRDLCSKTGHSRQTVGKCMRVLEREERIYRVPGLGYFVSYPEGQSDDGAEGTPFQHGRGQGAGCA
jgi:DNA-binding GntR family transcriptional regulator